MDDRGTATPTPMTEQHHPARTDAQQHIHAAVEILQAKHHVHEVVAYTILVQAAADSHSTVRETARRIVDSPSPD